VHPMRETAVEKFLEIAGADWSVVQQLIHKGLMVACEFDGKRFYRSAPWAGDQPGQSVGGKER
jgi:hypothetical protein